MSNYFILFFFLSDVIYDNWLVSAACHVRLKKYKTSMF